MRMFDLITKKKHEYALSDAEIKYMIDAFVDGEIPDYQMSAMLMAIWFNGMDDNELAVLTKAMADSGEEIDLSPIKGEKVDKHSTGGVGDKTTLVIAPIVAACGGKVAKMSGRGLGHTGGTIDKLESIPGLSTSFSQEEFCSLVNRIGTAIISQSGNLVPADKKLYALRDVTGTVDSIPLIASSIMSKKISSGSDCILLDVKTGSGAFMKTLPESIRLAQKMVAIGNKAGKSTVAVVTDMDIPLGNTIGNSLEVIEAIKVLQGKGPRDLTEICLQLAANMLYLLHKGDMAKCYAMARETIENGSAFVKFASMVQAQGGDVSYIYDTDKFSKARYHKDVLAQQDGYITKMNSEKCGIASMILGAGRKIKSDTIDFAAGIIVNKKYGDKVKKGEVLAQLLTNDHQCLAQAEKVYQEAITIGQIKLSKIPLIFVRIEKGRIEKF